MNQPDDSVDVDAQVVAPLQRAAMAVDDIHAARIAAAIEAGLDVRAAARPQPRRQLWAVASACALGAAAVVVMLAMRDASYRPAGSVPLELSPYVYAGPGAGSAMLAPAARLTVPAGAKLRASVGTTVRLTLVGPGSVAAAATADGATELALASGLLLVDFDHNRDGKLRVRAPGAIVTVVGTLFAVDARDGGVRVGVTRGAVSVQSSAGSRRVAAGSAWTLGNADPGAVPAELAAALAEHDASPPPPVGDSVVVDDRSLGDPPLVARVPTGSRVARDPAAARAVTPSPTPAPPPPAAAQASLAAAQAPAAWAAPETSAPATAPGGDAEALYATAEAQMRAGANDRARATLLELLARHGGDPRGEAALLDLARLSLAAGATTDARRYLARLADPTHDRALVEPARHLRCRVEVAAGAMAAAVDCLRAFRGQHPSSPHDAEVLSQLAAITEDCARARPLLDEYLRRYPGGPFAAQAHQRLRRCRPD
jgi:hypothetical protein